GFGSRRLEDPRRTQERATSANHIVINDHVPILDLGTHTRDGGVSSVQTFLENKGSIDPHVLGQGLYPLGPACVGGGEDKVLSSQLTCRFYDQRFPVNMEGGDVPFEIVRNAVRMKIEQKDAI